jgi:hypothetical protein
MLYDSRLITDQQDSPADAMGLHRESVDVMLRKTLARIIKLDLTLVSVEYPQAIPVELE